MDNYVYMITALLPLAAAMLIFQANPYHALVIRGVLGAVAALVYTVLGAADVALTEALVGTLLAIALYAVAVRSSLVLRLGVLKETIATNNDANNPQMSHFQQLIGDLQSIFGKRHLRVELISYLDQDDLNRALLDKEVHAICTQTDYAQVDRAQVDRAQSDYAQVDRAQVDRPQADHAQSEPQEATAPQDPSRPYHTMTRLRYLYDILKAELGSPVTRLSYVNASGHVAVHPSESPSPSKEVHP